MGPQAGGVERTAGEGDVHAPRTQPGCRVTEVELVHGHGHVRVLPAEGGDQSGTDEIGGVGQGTDDEGRLLTLAAHSQAQPLRVIEQVAGLLLEHVPRRSERDAGMRAFQQDDAEVALQLLHRAAQRGLSHVQARGCPTDVAFLGDHREVAQQPEIHAFDDTRSVSSRRDGTWTTRDARANDGGVPHERGTMMHLTFSGYRYETTQALFDGSVAVEGVDSTEMTTGRTLPEIFARFARDDDVDVSEFGMTFLLRALEAGEDYVALPVFPNRVFRHSCVFVSTSSGITKPEDLVDRTIGEFGMYGQDSGVWAKGILADDYGFRPEQNRWVIGGLDFPAPPFDFTTHPHPQNLEITTTGDGETLSGLLADGKIDALFTANVPQPFLDGHPGIRRLFPDHEREERAWYGRTGVFPMMHAMVVRRHLLEKNPGLDRALYNALLASKEAAADRYRQARRLFQVPSMLPWTNALYDADVELLGEDWWPYGLAANRTALDTYLRYHHEQGLSARHWRVEEIFAAGLSDT
jgi:hypothetical protein